MPETVLKKTNELSLSVRILLPSAVIFILFVYFSHFIVLPLMEERLMAQKREELKNMTKAAFFCLNHYNKQVNNGTLTLEQAQKNALTYMEGIRFGSSGKDFFWVNDFSPKMIMHPYRKDLMGKDLTGFTDPKGVPLFVRSVEIVNQKGEGYLEYIWQQNDDEHQMAPKISFVKGFAPWGWVIGTGVYVQDVKKELSFLTTKLNLILVGILGLAVAFSIYMLQQAMHIERKRKRAENINRVLIRISNSVNTTQNLESLYLSIHKYLETIIDTPNFFIALYDRASDAILFPYYMDEKDRDFPEIFNIKDSPSLTAAVITSGEPKVFTRKDVLKRAADCGQQPVGTPPELWVGVPLKIKGDVIGAMAVQSYTDARYFDKLDVKVLNSVSDQVALAIERKQTEKALKENAKQYRLLAENHKDVVISVSPSGILTYCSPAISEFGGYDAKEEIGKPLSDYFADANDLNTATKGMKQLVRGHKPRTLEFLFKPRAETPFPVEINAKPVVEKGRVVSIQGVMRDITNRKHAEKSLKAAYDDLEKRVKDRTRALSEINIRLENEIKNHKKTQQIRVESEEKYRTLVKNLPDLIYSTDNKGNIAAINQPATESFGYIKDDIIGKNFTAFLHPQEVNIVVKKFLDAVKHRVRLTRGLQTRIISKQGTVHWVEVNLRRQFDENGHFLRTDGIIRDITETKLLQAKLIRSERLAATGQLAASIAHEINSPLQGVTSLLSVIRNQYPDDKELTGNISLVKGAFSSIRNTVKNLLDLNRPGKERFQPYILQKVIQNTVSLIQGYLNRNNIRTEIHLSPDIPVLKGSPQQLGQVFINLINNAVEAMATLPEAGQKDLIIEGNCIKSSVVISISDTGPGIPEADLPYIFDAFFTRKKKMGMGVGLSICLGIIEDHNGTITANNNPEKGARFVVSFPLPHD